ncbi:MAG: hypothetical protein MUD12_14420 [Spirochaetes bacterium]|jgi:hypothetical protein|nr:hypothetical protein [Spirochaetota bacterium]
MKKVFIISLFMMAMVVCEKSDLSAWGIGPYIGSSAGASRKTHESIYNRDKNWITDGYYSTRDLYGGVMIDSNVSKNDLVGYRAGIGAGCSSFNDKRYLRFDANNILSFRLVQNESLRFWIGPQLGLHLDLVKNRPWPFSIKRVAMFSIDTGYNGAVDLGLAVGANIRISEPVYFTIDGGVKYNVNFNLSHVRYNDRIGSHPNKLLHGYETFLNMGFLYRMGEGGQEKTENKDKG